MGLNETSDITAVLLILSQKKTLQRRHAFGRLGIDLIQTWYDNRYNCTLHFYTSLTDPDLESRSQECEKAQTSAKRKSWFVLRQLQIDFFQTWHDD